MMNKIHFCQVLISKKILVKNLYEVFSSYLERTGFEILEEEYIGNNSDFPLAIIILDLLPWTAPKETLEDGIVSDTAFKDNFRLEWAMKTMHRNLNLLISARNLNLIQFDYNNPILIQYQSKNELNNNLRERTLKQILERVKQFNVPYQVVASLTNFGCNNRTDIINKYGKKYICKTFKSDRINYLENEINVRVIIEGLATFPEIIEKGNNYILIEYISNLLPINHFINRHGKYPIKLMHELFSTLLNIWKKKVTLLDFHPGNVLIQNKKRIILIDFEYCSFDGNESDFAKSHTFIRHEKYPLLSPMEDITLEKFWTPYLILSVNQLVCLPIVIINIIDLFFEAYYRLFSIIHALFQKITLLFHKNSQ